jgi:hypothetical protein
MALTKYEHHNFKAGRLAMIEQANAICDQYAEQGLTLTLRQLYYQFVARDLLANKQTEYNRLGELCRDARMAGLMDWDHLIDRTRNLQTFRTYDSPQKAMQDAAKKYHRDLWAPQGQRIEVWIEKDAAIGVVEGVCETNSVPFFSCRGYTSMSEMHDAAQRLRWHIDQGNQVTILHIGDHDPSGIDMSRDIEDRLRSFIHRDWAGLRMGAGSHTRGAIRSSMAERIISERDRKKIDVDYVGAPWRVKRIALNIDQIEQYSPPPNPAKTTDARFLRYREETGLDESWELDALEPTVLQNLIQSEVDTLRVDDIWDKSERTMEGERLVLTGISNWWDDVATFIEQKGPKA